MGTTTMSRRDFLTGTVKTAALAAMGATLLGAEGVAFAQSNDSLTPEQIAARFDEIRNRYSVGETLNGDDAQFVKQYATSENGAVTRGGDSFYMTASTVDAYVIAHGNAYHNGIASYTFGANATITNQSGGTPRHMKLTVRCDSFGILQDGSSTFNGSHYCSDEVYSQNSFYAAPVGGYSGVTAYWNLTLILTGTSANGNGFSGTY